MRLFPGRARRPAGWQPGPAWASADHAVCVVDAAGEVAGRFSVAHTAEGLRTLVQRLGRSLEWPHAKPGIIPDSLTGYGM